MTWIIWFTKCLFAFYEDFPVEFVAFINSVGNYSVEVLKLISFRV